MKLTARRNMKAGVNIFLAILTLAIFIFIVPRIIIYFMPFVIGWIIASIANPLVRFLNDKIKLKRKAGSMLVILLVIVTIAALGYAAGLILARQIVGFATDFPELWGDFEDSILKIGRYLEDVFIGFPDAVQEGIATSFEHMNDTFSDFTNSIGEYTVQRVSDAAKNFPTVLISVIMCLLSAYFFVAERETFLNFFKKRLSLPMLEKIMTISSNLRKAVGGYVVAQLKIEVYVYVLMVIGFFVLDVKYALLIALGIAILDMLPFFGTAIILIPWAILRLFEENYKMTIGLLIIWGAGQLLRQFIQPKIVGDSIGVPPIPTIFLLFLGFKLGGVIGMIIAVPIGIIVIKLEEAGAFDTPKNSIALLAKSINEFRKITEEEIAYIHENDITEEVLKEFNEKEEQKEPIKSELLYKKIELPIKRKTKKRREKRKK